MNRAGLTGFLIFLPLLFTTSVAQSILLEDKPQPFPSFKINNTQNVAASCSYSVTITTSCSSPTYTRDQISLAFGDAYGYQVYAPRLDDPSSGTFERCSTDTYEISGPCLYSVCYLYLYRSGYDGWIPESVQVYSSYTGSVTFYYNTYIPRDTWYGFNYCNGASSSKASAMKWIGHAFQVLFCLECWKTLFGSM
ncbi:hypothetical protein NMG60_11004912 [Bertholletia excelsa]